jgi:hypothetical protein
LNPTPAARASLGVSVVNGIIYAIGGYIGNEAYDVAADQWTTKASLPAGCTASHAVALNGLMYALGGVANTPENTIFACHPGTPPFTYQWFCNGVLRDGATNATLTITNFGSINVGAYIVTVSNAGGSATSPPALLATVDLKLFAGVVVNGPLGSN